MGRAVGWVVAFVLGVGLVYAMMAVSDDGSGSYRQPQVSGVEVSGVVVAPYVNERVESIRGRVTTTVEKTDYFLLLDTDGDGVGDTSAQVSQGVWESVSPGEPFERRAGDTIVQSGVLTR